MLFNGYYYLTNMIYFDVRLQIIIYNNILSEHNCRNRLAYRADVIIINEFGTGFFYIYSGC